MLMLNQSLARMDRSQNLKHQSDIAGGTFRVHEEIKYKYFKTLQLVKLKIRLPPSPPDDVINLLFKFFLFL